MILLGFKSFSKNLLLNIFIILQLTAVIVTSKALISNAASRYDDYEPFEELLDGYGEVIYIPPERVTDASELEEPLSKLCGVKSVYMSYIVPTDSTVTEEAGYSFNGSPVVYAYDDKLLSLCFPELEEGKLKKDDNYIYCLSGISSVGDMLLIKTVSTSDEPITLELNVSGRLADHSQFIGSDHFNVFTENCRDLTRNYYRVLDIELATDTIIVSADEMRKNGIRLVPQNIGVLEYASSLNADERTENDLVLNSFCGHVEFSAVKENTLNEIHSQLVILIPIVTMLVMTAVVSVIASSAVKVRHDLRNYAIYCINGARRSIMVFICFTEIGICAFCSLLLSHLLYIMLQQMDFSKDLIIKDSIISRAVAFAIAALSVMSAIVITHAMTRKESIKEQLYNEQ